MGIDNGREERVDGDGVVRARCEALRRDAERGARHGAVREAKLEVGL